MGARFAELNGVRKALEAGKPWLSRRISPTAQLPLPQLLVYRFIGCLFQRRSKTVGRCT